MDISSQGEMPFPLERGVSLAPGYATMIGLRKVNKTLKHSLLKGAVSLHGQKEPYSQRLLVEYPKSL